MCMAAVPLSPVWMCIWTSGRFSSFSLSLQLFIFVRFILSFIQFQLSFSKQRWKKTKFFSAHFCGFSRYIKNKSVYKMKNISRGKKKSGKKVHLHKKNICEKMKNAHEDDARAKRVPTVKLKRACEYYAGKNRRHLLAFPVFSPSLHWQQCWCCCTCVSTITACLMV